MSTNHEKPPIKHSPGPWKAEMFKDENDERWYVLADNGTQPYNIAVIENGQPGDTMETEGATARLMAAAPELLSALKCLLIVEMLRETAMSHGDESAVEAANDAKWSAVDAARTAIAKAEGKE